MIGTKVLVHGKNQATVTSVHKGGKRYGVRYADGKTTFVAAAACKPAPPQTVFDLPIAAWAVRGDAYDYERRAA